MLYGLTDPDFRSLNHDQIDMGCVQTLHSCSAFLHPGMENDTGHFLQQLNKVSEDGRWAVTCDGLSIFGVSLNPSYKACSEIMHSQLKFLRFFSFQLKL